MAGVFTSGKIQTVRERPALDIAANLAMECKCYLPRPSCVQSGVIKGSDYMLSPSSATTEASTGTATNESLANKGSYASTDSRRLSEGEIAGIFVGVLSGVTILSASVWLWLSIYRGYRRLSNTETSAGFAPSNTRSVGKQKPGGYADSYLPGASEQQQAFTRNPVELMTAPDGFVVNE